MTQHSPHAVSRLRTERLKRCTTTFTARGGPSGERCAGCRLILSHCFCNLRPVVQTKAGMCLIMSQDEALKPSNTGWLIADVVPDTWAFEWARTEVDAALLKLLADPQWQPYVVFPATFVAPERVNSELLPAPEAQTNSSAPNKRPLFILLDATWSEARKIFRKSPYLESLPVLSLQPEHLSRYRLRRSTNLAHLCTAEVAALCLALADEHRAADTLDAYLDVYTDHYLRAKWQRKVEWDDELHQRLAVLRSTSK